jgi:hypothetical protein
MFLTATSLSELILGIEIMPTSRRKDGLAQALNDLLTRLFGPRIVPFDQRAALAYAPIVSRARSMGRAISVADGQIAAVAKVHGFAVATRDTAPFIAAGISVIDPWRE